MSDIWKQMLDVIKTECSEPDWDGYGGLPVTEKSLETARRILNLFTNSYPEAVPTSFGGVQIEWELGNDYYEIEIYDDKISGEFMKLEELGE